MITEDKKVKELLNEVNEKVIKPISNELTQETKNKIESIINDPVTINGLKQSIVKSIEDGTKNALNSKAGKYTILTCFVIMTIALCVAAVAFIIIK